jgi:hypothetical protein
MRYLFNILLVLLFYPAITSAQQRQIGITPQSNNRQVDKKQIDYRPSNKNSNESIDPKTGFPSYLTSRKANKGDIYELKITVTSTEPYYIDKSSDFPYDEKSIPFSVETKVHYSDIRGQYYVVADFNAVFKDKSGQILKITSFEEEWVFKGKNTAVQNRNQRNFASSSVLSDGDWYKIGVIRDGIFKIDYALLQSLGVDMNNLPSDAINIYGNSFGMLPEENSAYRPDDLLKNAIKLYDGGDGIFNSGDYLLFYAAGPNKWKVSTSFFEHEQNYFSDTSYYFINIDRVSPNPKRIQDISLNVNPANQFVTSFNDYQVIEPEQINFFKSGRQWFSNQLFQDVNQYSFNFPNMQVGAQCKIDANVVAKAPVSSVFFTLTENGSGQFQTVQLNGSQSGDFYPNANISFFFTASSPSVNLTLSFNRNGMASANSWLDYIRLNVRRNLIFSGNSLFFRDINSVGAGNVSEFTLTSNNSNIEIWEITSPSDAGRVNTPHNGFGYTFRLSTDSLREFVAFTGNTFAAPATFEKVKNQNIHGLPNADLIIVSPNFLLDEAEDLADFHRGKGLDVNVISVEEIYNEFSSGMRDATAIKTMMKMFYERGLPQNKAPKYLTLLGDGSYDNRSKISRVSNLIPTYQSTESLNNFSTHTSDDYFGILGDTEGMNPKDLIDVAVGRIVAKNKTEAKSVINKIKVYAGEKGLVQVGSCNLGGEQSSLRDWRNVFCFITDDPDAGLDFLPAVETWVNTLKGSHPEYNYVRIHSDAYKQISTPGGPRYPDVEEAIRKRVENGALVVDYVGHGGEVGWAAERILDLSTINGWTNLYRLLLFMTVTCEFSRYDDPDRVSAGEQLLLNPNGGAIALYSTTRVVFAQSNDNLNSIFCDTVLKRINGKPQTIGEVFMGTKNRYAMLYNDINFRKFQLLGDPALRIASPEFQVITSHVNDEPIAGSIDTLNALRKITVKGFVADLGGTKLNNFNGVVYPTLFDKEQTINTLGNDPWSIQRPFDVRNINLFKGKASVINGEFEFTFIVPKDILFNYGNGRISYYAENGTVDANGYNEDIIVGGIYTGAQTDNTGPELTLYMNNENFVNGGLTNQNPVFFARFFDENGINTTGNGIGHDITAIIDEATDRAIILNEFYEAELDNYQRGSVRYPFNKLEDGPHTLSLKAWDVYNNSSTKTIDFVVAEDETVALTHVLNYPNPFTTSTEFFFEHNQNCNNLQVQLQIFTIAGNLVKTISQRVNMNGFRSEGIPWNGRDDYGDQLAKGVYIYRLKVVTETGESAEKLEKLVVLK